MVASSRLRQSYEQATAMSEDQKLIELVEGGLVLLMAAVKAGDPQHEIIWRIEEELRVIRARSAIA